MKSMNSPDMREGQPPRLTGGSGTVVSFARGGHAQQFKVAGGNHIALRFAKTRKAQHVTISGIHKIVVCFKHPREMQSFKVAGGSGVFVCLKQVDKCQPSSRGSESFTYRGLRSIRGSAFHQGPSFNRELGIPAGDRYSVGPRFIRSSCIPLQPLYSTEGLAFHRPRGAGEARWPTSEAHSRANQFRPPSKRDTRAKRVSPVLGHARDSHETSPAAREPRASVALPSPAPWCEPRCGFSGPQSNFQETTWACATQEAGTLCVAIFNLFICWGNWFYSRTVACQHKVLTGYYMPGVVSGAVGWYLPPEKVDSMFG